MPRRKKSMPRVKKVPRKKRTLKGFFARILVLALVGLVVVGAYWLYQMDRIVVEQFEGRKWAVPAHIYARPQELYAGLKLNQQAFVDKLDKLGYRKVDKLDRQASYTPGQDSVSLVIRLPSREHPVSRESADAIRCFCLAMKAPLTRIACYCKY